MSSHLEQQASLAIVKSQEALYRAQRVTNGFTQFESFANLANWEIVSQGTDDIIEAGGDSMGASYYKISKSPFYEDTETELVTYPYHNLPSRYAIGFTMSQRLGNQRAHFENVGLDANNQIDAYVDNYTPVTISNVAQTTTTLTVNTATAHNLKVGDRVAIVSPDSRACYPEAIVATIPTYTQFTVTSTGQGTIPSTTINSTNGGTIYKVNPLNNVYNSFSIVAEGTSANNLRYMSAVDGESRIESALTSFGTNVTVATAASASPLCDSLRPNFYMDMNVRPDYVVLKSVSTDSLTAPSVMLRQTQCVPNSLTFYKLRIRVKNEKNMSRPIAKIASVSKSGSTTWTVTTDVAHGLTTTDYVQLYGVRDQTNFPNLTTATVVASVVNSTTFTIVSTTGTATSYGGSVIKVLGQTNTGVLSQVVQSISRTGNLLTVVGNTNWSGISIAETVNLHGLYDTAGVAYPQYEGAYKVANVSTTSLTLYSEGDNFASINLGGAVIKRTDVRLHFGRITEYTRSVTDIESASGNSLDAQTALPVVVSNSPNVTVGNGQGAHNVAITGNPVRLGARALTANYTATTSGYTADLISTLVGALISKPYSIPEADFLITSQKAGLLNTTTPLQVKDSAGAGLRNYITGIDIVSEALTNATEFEIREPDLTCSSQTISSNTLTTSAVHNLVIGDAVVFTANTVTGISTNTTYYVLTVPTTTTLTLSATRGGSTLAISGTGVTATLHKYLWSTKIPTAGLNLNLRFNSPLRGSVATAMQIQTLTASGAGAVFFNAQGYVAP